MTVKAVYDSHPFHTHKTIYSSFISRALCGTGYVSPVFSSGFSFNWLVICLSQESMSIQKSAVDWEKCERIAKFIN